MWAVKRRDGVTPLGRANLAICNAGRRRNATPIMGDATVLGPLIVGLDKPIQIVQLGATDTDIVNMAALAAFGIGG